MLYQHSVYGNPVVQEAMQRLCIRLLLINTSYMAEVIISCMYDVMRR